MISSRQPKRIRALLSDLSHQQTWRDRGVSISEKPKLLAVVPYGMALRNLLLNTDLWDYLNSSFAVDLLTPLSVRDSDALGVRVVYGDPDAATPHGVAHRIRLKAAGTLSELDKTAFFMRSNEVETLRLIYYLLRVDGKASRLMFWSWLGHTRAGLTLRRLARSVAGSTLGGVDVRAYDLVFLGHNAENRSKAYGIAANRHGVPVVCMPMGLDNLMHGPLVFVPDLLLAWGDEQRRDFDLQTKFRPDLVRTECVNVGSAPHDSYLASGPGPSIDALYDLPPGSALILFAAHMNRYCGNQLAVCRLILEHLRHSWPEARLLVRTRPGFDEDMWHDFQRENPLEVRLQLPVSASYDKSENVARFDIGLERSEVALFAATMRRCAALVSPWFSTMETDALLFNKPAINAIFDPDQPNTLHPALTWYLAGKARIPEWGDMCVATSGTELVAALANALGRGAGAAPISERLFRYRATARDGRVGERAVAAMRAFMRVRSTTRDDLGHAR